MLDGQFRMDDAATPANYAGYGSQGLQYNGLVGSDMHPDSITKPLVKEPQLFAGLSSKAQPVQVWGDPLRILSALAPYSLNAPRDVWQMGRQALMQVATRTGADSATIFRHPESGVAVAFWGRLDNRAALISTLEAVHDASDDELIALSWLKWGEQCPEKLIGDFAFAVASPQTGMLFLARDVMGVKPLYYSTDDNGVFFASSVSAFKAVLLGELTRSAEWMARYLVDLSASHTDTAYEEIKKLPGAHSLSVHADGRISLRRYHRFIDDAPIESVRNMHWLEQYREVWREAIANRLPVGGPVASENSGGIDSGSITAEIARQLGPEIDRLHTYGFAREALEPEYIMATVEKFGIRHNCMLDYDGGRYVQEFRRRELLVHGFPQEHPDGAFHAPFYELCLLNGINVLHSGFGGDEGVTYPGGMPARLELLDQGHWRGLWRILPGGLPIQAARLAKTLKHSLLQPRHSTKFMSAWERQRPYRLLSDDAVEQYGIEEVFLESATYDERFRSINDAAIQLLSRSYAPIRLEACTLMAASYGIDYVWPLLDQRLVQRWLSTPTVWKVGDGGIGRYLHRRAIDGVCPDMVAWKPRKDMGVTASFQKAENADNAGLLRQLIDLSESLPNALKTLIDAKKARFMAEQGIRKGWKGTDINCALEENVSRLDNLVEWLNEEP